MSISPPEARRAYARAYARAYYHSRSKERYRYIVTPLEHDQHKRLQAFAQRNGWSVAETLRTFIEWGLQQE